jgi:hypothetical protein
MPEPLLGNGRKQTRLHINELTRNNRGTVGNGIFYNGLCRGVTSERSEDLVELWECGLCARR